MSFTVFLSSLDGTRINGLVNEIQYNFDWQSVPKHSGRYKVSMTFNSEAQNYNPTLTNYGLVNIDLGTSYSYSTQPNYTSMRNNQICGIIRTSDPQTAVVSTVPQVVSSSVTSIPANSGTSAYTQTTTTTTPTYLISHGANYTVDSLYGDNPPFYIQTTPRQNQFIVRLTYPNTALYDVLTVDYALVLTFEAI